MNKQVVTISPDGTISGLQRKPGQGVDLRQFGKAAIVRASEIAWDDHLQKWFVDVMQEAGKGPMTLAKWLDAGLTICQGGGISAQGLLIFDDYDMAVKAEIAFLDALRLRGEF